MGASAFRIFGITTYGTRPSRGFSSLASLCPRLLSLAVIVTPGCFFATPTQGRS